MSLLIDKFNLIVDNTYIKGQAFIPQPWDSKKGLIICHGIPGEQKQNIKKSAGYDYLGRLFCQQGFLTLIFNFRGTGESGGNLDLRSWVEDLQEVKDYYYANYSKASSSLTLMGFSAGAAVAIEVVARDHRIKALALGACPGNFEFFLNKYTNEELWQWFNRAGLFRRPEDLPAKEVWLKRFLSIRPENKIIHLAHRNLLIMHGDKDDVVPPEHAEKLYFKAGGEKRLVVFPGVNHRIRNYRKVLRYLQIWLEEV